jgi:hypothetical protein
MNSRREILWGARFRMSCLLEQWKGFYLWFFRENAKFAGEKPASLDLNMPTGGKQLIWLPLSPYWGR